MIHCNINHHMYITRSQLPLLLLLFVYSVLPTASVNSAHPFDVVLAGSGWAQDECAEPKHNEGVQGPFWRISRSLPCESPKTPPLPSVLSSCQQHQSCVTHGCIHPWPLCPKYTARSCLLYTSKITMHMSVFDVHRY